MRRLLLGDRRLVMGVVNVTPNSFSDGGLYFTASKATAQALRLLDEGADIVDLGGESTRPGASQGVVSEAEEVQRVIPVIEAVKKARPDAYVSIDTYKSAVARAAVQAGAEIVNDVSGFLWDEKMLATLSEMQCGAVLMHMRGRPAEWRSLPPIGDAVGLVKRELAERAAGAVAASVTKDRLVLDPGFGFGKSFDENYPLLAGFANLHELGFPLLAGVSRKSFIGRTLSNDGKDAAVTDRLHGTLAAETALVLAGAHIIRTHDVRACVDAMRIADAIRQVG